MSQYLSDQRKDGTALLSYIERHAMSARDEAARQSPHFECGERSSRGGPHQNDARSSLEVLTDGSRGHKARGPE